MTVVGVDMIEVDRIAVGLERFGRRFLDRFFTGEEQRQCGGRATSLAGRFAAKEATGKALGTGIGDVGWRDIEVLADERGRPRLILHNDALRLAQARGLSHWAISISHTTGLAIAFVVAHGEGNPGEVLPLPSLPLTG